MDSKADQSESEGEHNDVKTSEHSEDEKSQPHTGDRASAGKIFIGGLAKATSLATFTKYFGKYGEMTDSVIMKDRQSGQPRGFGFVTYADPSVVDKVIQETHIINGKQVEIKRTVPKGDVSSKDFKTKKIFVGGIPQSVTDDEFKNFFSKFGEVVEHQILRDHATSRSRGFGFITFETEQAVDDILVKGNKLELAGVQVEIKRAEPKKPNPPAPKHFRDPRPTYGGGFGDAYGGFGGGGAYRSSGGFGARPGVYGGYSGSEFGGGYGYGGSGLGAYRGEPSIGYSSRYDGGFGRGYESGAVGGYGGPGEGYGGYGSGGYGSSYDSGLGAGFGGRGGGLHGTSGGYGGGGAGRYHPYAR